MIDLERRGRGICSLELYDQWGWSSLVGLPVVTSLMTGVDCDGAVDAYSGYLADGVVWGFSMTHNSGTGGAPKYGVVSQMPWVGNLTNPISNLTSNRTEPDQAAVGYYRVSLDSEVIVELAASERAGMYRYTFGNEEEVSNVVVDVSHVLPSYRGFGWSQSYTMGGIEVYEDGHYELNGTYDNGWNIGKFDLVTSRDSDE